MRSLIVILLTCGVAIADVKTEVHFSPHGGCEDVIVKLIDGARKTIRQSAYAYSSRRITDATLAAIKRGVDFQLVLDRSWRGRTQPSRLIAAKVTVWIDSKHAIMHDKVLIVDDSLVETGSFNYTEAAEKSNAENCLVIREDADLIRAYDSDWRTHRDHSVRDH